MQDLLGNSNLKKFTVRYAQGETLFLEGDLTSDLFILVSGRLDILKGPKKISEIHESGMLFGEMAFLVGEKRTATIKAASPVEAVKIPGNQVDGLLQDVPNFGVELARTMARRLQNTTTMAYGLKEFCDQLPDAVMITTDQDQKILAWNAAAEKLYGREGDAMRDLPLKDIYSDPEAYEKLQESLTEGKSTNGLEMQVQLPGGNERFVSTSTTMLYDGHYNVQGLLFLARDVTKLHELENKYRKIRNWLIPSLALVGAMAALFFYTLPSLTRGSQILDYKENSFKEQVEKGHTLLAPELTGAVRQEGDYDALLGRYFAEQNPARYGIDGIILLKPDKTVVAAYLPGTDQKTLQIVGNSYAALPLSTDRKKPVSLLTMFRAEPGHPMGKQTNELAWRLSDNHRIGWLVFQLNMEFLEKEFGVDTAVLKNMRFKD